MPLPVGLSTRTVRGRHVFGSGAAAGPGSIIFRAPHTLVSKADDVTVLPTVYSVELTESTDQWSITLPATDDPTIEPAEWAYVITVRLPGYVTTFNAAVPADAAPLDFTDLVPLVVPDPLVSYATGSELAAEVAARTAADVADAAAWAAAAGINAAAIVAESVLRILADARRVVGTELTRWNGDGLSAGNLTIGSAGPGDTAPSFITGATPTIVASGARAPAIRFAQIDTTVNYVQWNFSPVDLAAYACRHYTRFDAFVASGLQSVVQFVNAGETLFSWGVTLTPAGVLGIIDKNGSTQATGTVPLVAATEYRIEAVVNASRYDVYAYVGESVTPIEHIFAYLSGPVPGGRIQLGNKLGNPQAPPFLVDSVSVIDAAALIGPV